MSDVRLVWGRELDLGETQKGQIAGIVCDAFAPKFAAAHIDREQIVGVLRASIDWPAALYALDGEDVVGVLGLTTADERFFQFTWRAMRDNLLLHHALLGLVLVAMDRACPAGELRIEPLAVSPGWRGRGIGTRLLERIIAESPGMGIVRVALDVVDTNLGAQRLYERMGFEVVRTQRSGLFTRRAGFSATHYMQMRPDRSGEAT